MLVPLKAHQVALLALLVASCGERASSDGPRNQRESPEKSHSTRHQKSVAANDQDARLTTRVTRQAELRVNNRAGATARTTPPPPLTWPPTKASDDQRPDNVAESADAGRLLRRRRDDEPQHREDPQVSASAPPSPAPTIGAVIPTEAQAGPATAESSNQTQIVLDLGAFEAAQMGFFRHEPLISVILTVAYSIVFIIGLVGNSLVVAIVCKSPRMRTVTNYFIANLALADILVLVFCLPVTLVGNLFIPYVLGQFVCKTVSYLQGVAVSASINTMVTVTMDRFLAICFPMDWHMDRRMARRIIACIWLYSMTISLPWALFFTLVPYPLERVSIQVCAEEWPNEQMGKMYFVFANLILLYLLPAVVIIFCYLGIWYKIERRNIPGDGAKAHKIELIMQKSKIKVVKMMMVVVVIFLLSWLPLYLIFARVKLADERHAWEDWLIATAMPLAQWLGASNSCINPILYTFFNKKYKRGFIDLLRCVFCCGPRMGSTASSSNIPNGAFQNRTTNGFASLESNCRQKQQQQQQHQQHQNGLTSFSALSLKHSNSANNQQGLHQSRMTSEMAAAIKHHSFNVDECSYLSDGDRPSGQPHLQRRRPHQINQSKCALEEMREPTSSANLAELAAQRGPPPPPCPPIVETRPTDDEDCPLFDRNGADRGGGHVITLDSDGALLEVGRHPIPLLQAQAPPSKPRHCRHSKHRHSHHRRHHHHHERGQKKAQPEVEEAGQNLKPQSKTGQRAHHHHRHHNHNHNHNHHHHHHHHRHSKPGPQREEDAEIGAKHHFDAQAHTSVSCSSSALLLDQSLVAGSAQRLDRANSKQARSSLPTQIWTPFSAGANAGPDDEACPEKISSVAFGRPPDAGRKLKSARSSLQSQAYDLPAAATTTTTTTATTTTAKRH